MGLAELQEMRDNLEPAMAQIERDIKANALAIQVLRPPPPPPSPYFSPNHCHIVCP